MEIRWIDRNADDETVCDECGKAHKRYAEITTSHSEKYPDEAGSLVLGTRCLQKLIRMLKEDARVRDHSVS